MGAHPGEWSRTPVHGHIATHGVPWTRTPPLAGDGVKAETPALNWSEQEAFEDDS